MRGTLLLVLLLAACPGSDTGRDARDTANEADAASDASDDADAIPDAVEDTTADTAPDAVEDTTADTAPDTVEDTTADTAPDTVEDTTADTSPDAPDGSAQALPPWLAWCDAGCAAMPPLVLAACPGTDPGCTPARATTVVPSIDGRRISAVAFPLSLPDDAVLRLVEGNGTVVANLVTAYAPSIELRSDLDIKVSYYELEPVWGGTTALDFVSTSQTSELLDSVFYRHPSYDTGTAATDLHTQGQLAIAAERELTGIVSEHVHGFFMPMELAAVAGEGNFSYGDGTVTSNYGNPPYIAALGGIMNVAFPRFAHECAHELFDEVRAAFTGDSSCLNEGIADALAFVVGYLPEQDFGPVGVRGIDFDGGCSGVSEVHDVGNCYFWHVKKAGLLTPEFMHGIFHPQHTFDFDSCHQELVHTGNSILVYFTEAAGGADMIPVLDSMGLPHAGSYQAALVDLGL